MDPSQIGPAIAGVARNRRSVRDYAPAPVEAREVAEVVALAATAPSAWNLQPWRFVVVTDPDAKEALQAAAFGQRQVTQAPVVVVIYTDMVEALGLVDEALHPSMPPEAREATRGNILRTFDAMPPDRRDQWGRAQGYIVLGYLLLLLEAHGFGTSPMVGFDPAAVRKALGLPDHAEVPAMVAVGRPRPEHPGPQHRLPPERLIRFVEGPAGPAQG